MSDLYKDILISVAKVALIVVIAFTAGQRHMQKRLILPQKERVDTLFIHDTIVSEKPVFVEKKVTERVLVPVTDTLRVTDTLYVWMDREQIRWSDAFSDVYASGMQVQVDSVIHRMQTQVITQEKEVIVKCKSRWGVGIHAGYGAFAKNGQISTSPYIGVGISYNLLTW